MKRCTIRVVKLALMTALATAPGCAFLFPDVQNSLDELGNKGFVGRVSDRDALVAVQVEGDEVLAYVCDGVEGSGSLSAWFEGKLSGQQMDLGVIAGTTYETTSLGATLTGTIGESGAAGVLKLEDGSELPWTAETARANAAGGLYSAGGEEEIIGVIVDNTGEVRGLSRSRVTGWTSRVVPTTPLRPATRLPVQYSNRDGVPVRREIPLATNLSTLRPIIRPRPDPLPPADAGTLMVHVPLVNEHATGHRYIEKRRDSIGVPTLRLSAQLLDPQRPQNVLGAFMRVTVLDATGKVLSTHFIDDPLSPYLEAPESQRGASMRWVDVGRRPTSFLVAVPDMKAGRKVTFSRFRSSESPIFAGTIDLQAQSVPKPIRASKQSARSAVGETGYDTDDAEYDTVVSNGAPQDRVDILFVAEGFQDTISDRELFNQEVNEVLAHLWSTYAIYDQMRPAINVHSAFIPSRGAGAGNEDAAGNPAPNDTPFQAYYSCDAGDTGQPGDECRLLKITEDGADFLYEIAQSAPGNYGAGSPDTICLLVNDARYGGAAIGGGGLMRISLHADGPDIFAHEFGHAAIGLSDEYETEYTDTAIAASLLRPNVDGPLTANDPTLKWSSLVAATTAIPTALDDDNCEREEAGDCSASTLPLSADGTYQTVGMYEGAGYAACGSFRPSTSCRMRCAVNHFCAVCDKAFRDAFAPFVPPTIDLFVRDNSLDLGDVPSPSGVGDGDTGIIVKPWQSPDVRVDAPPFTLPENLAFHVNENPIAGLAHRVYVTVHNRGTEVGPHFAQTLLYFAPATGGAPQFTPVNWNLIASQPATVAGLGGEATLTFNWTAPADLPSHACMIALVDNEADPYPAANGGLSTWVRNSNNVTWKNLHVVTVPVIEGEISNFERQIVPTVLRIDTQTAPGTDLQPLPVGTQLTLTYQTNIVLLPFPSDGSQMTQVSSQTGEYIYSKSDAQSGRLSFQTDLPAGAEGSPFVSTFRLSVQLPGGTPTGQNYAITISQYALDSATGIVGNLIGGNTYFVSFN